MKYYVTGRLVLAGNKTAPIRTGIEANSPEEARQKFQAFLLRKASVEVEECKPEVAPKGKQTFEQIMQEFDDLLKSDFFK